MRTVPLTARAAPPAGRPGRLLTVRALAMFLLCNAALPILGLARILALLTRRRPRAATWPEPAARGQARRTFAAVQRATMLYYRQRRDCLPKAVTTFHLLRCQGLPADLCFGVRKYPFGAHSWVEAHGERLDDDPPRIDGYTVIHRIAG